MKKWFIIFFVTLFQSCSYQLFVPNDRIIYEEIGFLLITGYNDYFIPYKLKSRIHGETQQYINAKYLNSFAYIVRRDKEMMSELRKVYGVQFFIKNMSSESLVTKDGYISPKDSICYLIPVEISYITPKPIFKSDTYTATWMYGNEKIEFKYTSEMPQILSIIPYFTEERKYYLQDKYYSHKDQNNENKLIGVDIYYYKQIIHYSSEQDCESIGLNTNDSTHLYSKDIVFLKSLRSDHLLNRVQNLSAKFSEDSSDFFGEPGIHCRLIFENGMEQSMCLDWFGNFKVGGKNIGRNDTLCYILRSNIGFYEFNIVKDEELIIMFPEYRIGEQLINK